jgi:drug/metabolite transporter (DMT)-like permease
LHEPAQQQRQSCGAAGGSRRQRTCAAALGVVAGILAAFIFGGGAVVSRHLVTAELDPVDLTLLRFLGCFPIALAVRLGWAEAVRLELPWRRLATLLVLGGPPYHLLLVSGYLHATSGGGALLVTGLLPVFAIAIALSLTGGLPSFAMLTGVALTLAGMVAFGGLGSEQAFSLAGLAIFATAALAWALLNHCVGVWQIDPMRLTVALALWSPLFVPAYLLLRPWQDLPPMSADLLLQLVYHGWLVAFAATMLCFMSVRLAGAQWAAALLALTPICAAVLGAALLGERLGVLQLSGAALVAVGVGLISAGNGHVVRRGQRRLPRFVTTAGGPDT